MKVMFESPLEIEECIRRLKNSYIPGSQFQQPIGKVTIRAHIIGKHGSIEIVKLYPGGFGFSNFFVLYSFKLKKNGEQTTVYVNIGTNPIGIAIVLIIIGCVIFMTIQFINGAENLDSFISIMIVFAGFLAILLAGRVKDGPNTLIKFIKSTLDINDSDSQV